MSVLWLNKFAFRQRQKGLCRVLSGFTASFKILVKFDFVLEEKYFNDKSGKFDLLQIDLFGGLWSV